MNDLEKTEPTRVLEQSTDKMKISSKNSFENSFENSYPSDQKEEVDEPMLQESIDRFTNFPIIYSDIWKEYKTQEAALWTAEEIDYNADLDDWNKLNDDERYFIEHVLAFFAGADGIVLENLMGNFAQEVQWAEARAFYAVQGYIEQVHSQTYSQLIETFIKDPKRKKQLFNAIEEIPCVKRKAEWALKWMDPKKASFAERLVAFSVVEGIFFSGSFCAIFWLKSRGKMVKALGTSNELIARDEGLHCRFAITLYKHLKNKLSKETIHKIFREAVSIEREFITESLPCKLIGMNSTLMTQYIKYVADYWVSKLGYPKIYNVNNPFSFMDLNGMDGKTNFFEKRTTEYSRASAVTSKSDRSFEMGDDF
jgi:ribonucleoside-diphosphate reductase beta chain